MTDSLPAGQVGTEGDYFDITKFEELLNRLESSKGRQQRQKSLEGRRDIYAQGLASPKVITLISPSLKSF
jgi:hypothetical protein